MESEKRVPEADAHIMVLPFHSQGHINPMLQFSKRLASKGLKITLVMVRTSNTTDQSMISSQTGSINIEIIPEVFERRKEGESIEDSMERFRVLASKGLADLARKRSNVNPPKILIFDSVLPWAQGIAEVLGLDGIPFFTQSCAVSAIYIHFYKGLFNTPLEEESTISMPFMPLLRVHDLPSFVNVKTSSDSALLELVLSQFSNFQNAKWILFNTFDKLEEQVTKYPVNPYIS